MLQNEIILTFGGALVGVVGVVLGGGAFWSIPLFQVLYPDVGFGVLVGNLKVGAAFRGAASSISTWRIIDKRRALVLAIPMLLGAAVGATSISKLDNHWVALALLISIVVVECSSWLAARAKPSHFLFGSLILGVYTGFFGAGCGILIVALLRLRIPEDDKVAYVKAEARFIEMFMSVVAVAAHFASGNIVNKLWIPWSIGSVVGGFLGGWILNQLGTRSGRTQKNVLRVSYTLALIISILVAEME